MSAPVVSRSTRSTFSSPATAMISVASNSSTPCPASSRRRQISAQLELAGDPPAARTPLSQRDVPLQSAEVQAVVSSHIQPSASHAPAEDPDGARHDAEPSLTLRLSKPSQDEITPAANGRCKVGHVGSGGAQPRTLDELSGGSKATPQSSSHLQLAQLELPTSTGASRPPPMQSPACAAPAVSGRCAVEAAV
jgi:hypothetical protein